MTLSPSFLKLCAWLSLAYGFQIRNPRSKIVRYNEDDFGLEETKKLRQKIIEDLEMLSLRMKHALTDPFKLKYKEVAALLRDQDNLFILAKGTGTLVGSYMAEKFTQVTAMHAESYPSGEFRHGPLSMIDEDEKTPGKQSIL